MKKNIPSPIEVLICVVICESDVEMRFAAFPWVFIVNYVYLKS